MVQPTRPWPRPTSYEDRLSEIVASGDINSARAHFDKLFWENDKDRPNWKHLKLALVREDLPMMKLLATWGAAPNDTEMAQFRTLAKDKYTQYLRLLRSAGLKGVGTDWAELPAAPLPKGEEAETLEDPITKLPAEWLKVLKTFRQVADEAVIAGGARRDTFNGAAVKDVDIFLRARGNQKKHKALLQEVFAATGLKVHEQPAGYSGYDRIFAPFPDPATEKETTGGGYSGITRKRLMESWRVVAGPNKTEYNVIFVDDSLDKALTQKASPRDIRDIFAGGLLDAFDIALCQIATDGDTVASTMAYKEDVRGKKISLLRPNATSDDHVKRVVKKYPDWKPNAAAKEALKPKPPQSRYSYY